MTYRDALPQLDGDLLFLTDGGLETDLIFRRGIDLPHFAACTLLLTGSGRATLRDYYRDFATLAIERGAGFILDTVTWRANPDWIRALGYPRDALDDLNRSAVDLAAGIRAEFRRPGTPIPIAGVVGPRGDGYRPGQLQSVDEAGSYHSAQIEILADTAADLVTALTITYPAEGAGIAIAARELGMPVAISFTVETDGRLATGETLGQAIDAVDELSDFWPAYYMVNCCHPSHLPAELETLDRVRGFRANASALSHAQLDESEQLDAGDPVELGAQIRELRDRAPQVSIVGGCCGTDIRHLRRIAAATA